jgi:hypothetical protein
LALRCGVGDKLTREADLGLKGHVAHSRDGDRSFQTMVIVQVMVTSRLRQDGRQEQAEFLLLHRSDQKLSVLKHKFFQRGSFAGAHFGACTLICGSCASPGGAAEGPASCAAPTADHTSTEPQLASN